MSEHPAAISEGTLWQTSTSIALALLLVGMNAFFVAAEFSIVRVRRTRLEELAGEGVEAARVTILLVDRLSTSLATTQLGVTMASLGVGWLGEGAFARLLALLFPTVFASGGALHLMAAGLAFATVTFLHVVFGELIPKNVALERAEAIALLIARPLWVCGRLSHPVIWALSGLANAIMRIFGHHQSPPPPLSEEELKLVMKDSHEGGVITKGEAQIIHRAFEFADRTAADVMIPVDRVDRLSLSRSVQDNLAVATRSQHTRLPLCADGLDSVIGIVNMKDAWPLLASRAGNEVLEAASRPVTWIDPAARQDQVLEELKRSRSHMACVRAPGQARILGVITLEDVLEALLGDVREGRPAGPPQPAR